MAQIRRGRLTTGASWTVPVIVIGAAAPTAAASGCSEVEGRERRGDPGRGHPRVAAEPVRGRLLPDVVHHERRRRQLAWPGQPCCETNESVALRGLGTNSGNDFRGTYSATYVLVGWGGNVCPAQVLSFTAV